ncbi:MAG: ABC transporter ATP-binding protein [Phototrophicales bacterium]
MSIGLKARNLVVEFGTLRALGPLTVQIQAGQFVSIVGPSGCGKSTLIRVFAGLQAASSGEAWLGEQLIQQPSMRVGMMFQSANLMPWRTVMDNIALPLELSGVSSAERQAAVRTLLPLLNLEEFATTYPDALSGGMAQRVALGRVLIQKPDVLLLDEPFGALDAMTREQISLDLLTMWAKDRQTAIMVTHDIHEAVLLSDRVLVMSPRPGQIVEDIAVDLPRPRHIEQTYDTEFAYLAQTIRKAIRL